jgi:hypothetical protein
VVLSAPCPYKNPLKQYLHLFSGLISEFAKMTTQLTPRQLSERLMQYLNTGDDTIAEEIISEGEERVDIRNACTDL